MIKAGIVDDDDDDDDNNNKDMRESISPSNFFFTKSVLKFYLNHF